MRFIFALLLKSRNEIHTHRRLTDTRTAYENDICGGHETPIRGNELVKVPVTRFHRNEQLVVEIQIAYLYGFNLYVFGIDYLGGPTFLK
jgi:hypothetical protein